VKNVSLAPTGWNTVVLPPGNVFTGPPDVVDSVPFLVAWIANAPITVAIIQGDTTTVIGTGASGRVTTPSAITLGPAQFQITAGSTPIESIRVSVLSAQSEGYLPLAGGTMLGPIVGTLTGTASNTKELQGVSVSETAPATSDVLEYNGTEWVPSVPSAALPTPTATGDVLTATGTEPGDYDWATIASELPVPGASGDVLTATGTAAGDYDWAAPGSSSPQLAVAQFTSSGSWTVPAGVTAAEVVLIGGGGAGAGISGETFGGSGGGAGQITYSVVATTPGDTLTIAIGAGGASNTQDAGAASTCTGAATANGGVGGVHHSAGATVPGGTGGGYGGGSGGTASVAPTAGSAPGAGGGGAYMDYQNAGAAGADGYCEIRYIAS